MDVNSKNLNWYLFLYMANSYWDKIDPKCQSIEFTPPPSARLIYENSFPALRAVVYILKLTPVGIYTSKFIRCRSKSGGYHSYILGMVNNKNNHRKKILIKKSDFFFVPGNFFNLCKIPHMARHPPPHYYQL